MASEEGTVTKTRLGEKHALRQVLEDEVEAEARELIVSGTETDVAKARVRAWQSDRERLTVYHFPGSEQVGSAAITSARTRLAADKAVEHVERNGLERRWPAAPLRTISRFAGGWRPPGYHVPPGPPVSGSCQGAGRLVLRRNAGSLCRGCYEAWRNDRQRRW